MKEEKIKKLEEEHEALSDIIINSRKIGVRGNQTAKWFADLRVIINSRLDEIEGRLENLDT